MKGNTQILTFDLFKRICDSYEQDLAHHKNSNKEKEDSLASFSDFFANSFERYNIEWSDNDYSKLYSLYLYSNSNSKAKVDFSDLGIVSQAYYDFLAIAQPAGFFINEETDPKVFSTFVEQTTSAKTINEETRNAIYALLKFAEANKKMSHADIENLMNVITDKNNNLNLRKKHPIAEYLGKKGGTFLTVACGAFFGIAGLATLLPVSGLVAATAINNIISCTLIGGPAGALLAYAGIKIKNFATKRHYRKYNSTEKDLIDVENGTITTEDLKINKLIEKVGKTNAKIAELKKPLAEAKGFGKIKNAFIRFGRKIQRHALNVVNRNRIHAISDELQIINNRINEILSSNLSDGERFARVESFEPIRTKIATLRAKELVSDVARLLTSNGLPKLENIDIYAKDILRDEKATRAQEKYIDRRIAAREKAKTTADTDLSDNTVSERENVKTKAREILESLFRRDGSLLAGKYVFGCGVDIKGKLYTPVKAEGVINKLNAYNEVLNEICYISTYDREQLEPEAFEPNTTAVANKLAQMFPTENQENAENKETIVEVVEEPETQVEKPITPANDEVLEVIEEPKAPVVEEPIHVIEEPKTPVVEEPVAPQERIIRKMVLSFKVKPITKKGETVGKRLELTKVDGTKETFKFNGDMEVVDHMIAATVKQIVREI